MKIGRHSNLYPHCFCFQQGVFKEFDKDNSGNLSSYELRAALNSVGKF